MTITDLNGRRFSIWMVDEAGEQIVAGGWFAQIEDGALVLIRSGGRLHIEAEWIDRVRPITNDEVRNILGDADFFIKLHVGTLPTHGTKEMLPTGIKWPTTI